MSEHVPGFSVVVPTRGDAAKLLPLLDSLDRQTLPRDHFEILVSFDGAEPGPELRGRLSAAGARAIASTERRGPGAARNRAAREAQGAFLAFTEDDCAAASDWLEAAAAHLHRDPSVDVLEGATIRPDGRPTRRPDRDHLHYLPTNLFVRRSLFEDVGGYCEDFYDPKRGIYFREDSDFGFSLEEKGARTAREPAACVTHPFEHSAYFDPLRWARRYEMDPLLNARHPDLFRDRIEVLRVGPFTLRRLFVRCCFAYVIALVLALIVAITGDEALASTFVILAAAALIPIWAKWGFNLLRLPVVMTVPFVLAFSYAVGAVSFVRARPASP